MPHIDVSPEMPGIRGLMAFKPETGRKLSELAQALLRGTSSLAPGERELLATYVSSRNDCTFCTRSHAAAARHLLGEEAHLAHAVIADVDSAPVDARLRALLAIAGKVVVSGKNVTPEDVHAARAAGADDVAIHDAVLIAAAFCMFNRYVDGLAALTPLDEVVYDQMGQMLATQGYVR